MKKILPSLTFLAFIFIYSPFAKAQEPQGIIENIVNLHIGLKDYIIGKKLTGKQKQIAFENQLEDAYAGTYKFKVDNSYVVASKETDMVLAIRSDHQKIDKNQFKSIIAHLMDLYGEPTAMAHEKVIYWAYSTVGKITPEMYGKARSNGNTLIPLLTVKLNSSEEFTHITESDESKADIYILISSGPVIKQFLTTPSKTIAQQ